ncbi:MAG: 30S ribosomal protein S14 [Candidatus Aenigmatarchaeota archaeon]|nr:MAG: 30S ribosomal protein S14 [Candidatus Aenigmarchaeota archaeon]
MDTRNKELPAQCRRCKSTSGVITKYNLYYCRHCFREIANRIGFKKYD